MKANENKNSLPLRGESKSDEANRTGAIKDQAAGMIRAIVLNGGKKELKDTRRGPGGRLEVSGVVEGDVVLCYVADDETGAEIKRRWGL